MTEEVLLHHNKKPLTSVYDVEQITNLRDWNPKPKGLWVSVSGENDWESWCRSEDFCTYNLETTTRVYLADDANILRIVGAAELDVFTAEYAYNSYEQSGLPPRFNACRWDLVAKKYDGIIIAPYIWERRMSRDSDWYYSWDVASGCIWNSRAIGRLEVMKEAA